MKLTLIERKPEVHNVESFTFQPKEPLTWKAGQYIHYVLHHRPTDDRGSDRWFTISSAPYEGFVRITTRFTDDTGSTFKKKLRKLQVGKSIEMSFLEGDFIVENPDEEFVFIAGGIGITPFRSILQQLHHEGKQIHGILLYANKDNNIVFKDELEAIAHEHPHFTIHYIFSPEHIDEAKIKQYVPDLKKPIFYISGPEPMTDSLGNLLKDMGIEENHIQQDWFPGYPQE